MGWTGGNQYRARDESQTTRKECAEMLGITVWQFDVMTKLMKIKPITRGIYSKKDFASCQWKLDEARDGEKIEWSRFLV